MDQRAFVNLAWNQIKTLPPSFCDSQFGVLLLTGNPLTALPENFGNFGLLLQNLNISNTSIADLPSSFFHLKGLEELNIRRTKLTKKHLDLLKKKLPNCTVYSDFE